MTAEELFWLDAPYKQFTELKRGTLCVREPSGFNSAHVGWKLGGALQAFVTQHDLGAMTGEGGGYTLETNPDTVRAPDIAFVRRDRKPATGWPDKFFDGAPDLTVEVMSPSNRRKGLAAKMQEYIDAGTRLGWLVDLWARRVFVYRPGCDVEVVNADGILLGHDVIPGFRFPVATLFEE
jgi:Uma2 family endonuclease